MNKEKNIEDIDEMIEKIESFNYDFVSKTRLIMNYPITMTVDNDTHDAIMKMLKEYKKILKEKKEYKNAYETEQLEKESWMSVVLGLKNEVENLKQKLKKKKEHNKIIKDTKCFKRNGKTVDAAIKLREELLKIPEGKLCGVKKCRNGGILLIGDEVIPIRTVKFRLKELDKQEQELQETISDEEREEHSDARISFDLMDIDIRREELQKLIERSDNND